VSTTATLAIDGGEPVRRAPLPIGKGADLIDDEEIEAVTAVLRDRTLFRYHSPRTPQRVEDFEAAVCEQFEVPFALATSSGTAALRCALAALGIGCGDEVIVPAFTFIATISAVVSVGAVPVCAEVDDTLTLDPDDVAARLSERTRAIVPVHLENAAADLDALLAVAARSSCALLEDAAQAVGTAYHGRTVGTIGDVGACSLQATKNITTGEGGLLLTADEDIYVRAARFHDQGGQFVTQYRGSRGPARGESFVGDNLRMTEIAGALGSVQLRRLPSLLDAMRANCMRVRDAIGTIDRMRPRRLPDVAGAGGSSLTWFTPDAGGARRFVAALRAEGIPAAQMYEGEPVYANEALRGMRTASTHGGPWHCAEHPTTVDYEPGSCPRTEDLVARSVTVAIGPWWSADDCDDVARAVTKVAQALLG
jgi:8-amino-3,8-dideoxy-alpha-D-manno-octulosonate transaminase